MLNILRNASKVKKTLPKHRRAIDIAVPLPADFDDFLSRMAGGVCGQALFSLHL
jgi:hypothetical protein